MRLRLVTVFAVASLLAVPVAAIERLSVQVICQLAEHRYRVNLTDAQTTQIEADCASQVAALLAEKIRFLDFVAGTPRDNRLQVRLGKTSEEASPTGIRAVDLEIRVIGADVHESGEALIWPFRSVAEYLEVPSADVFATAIAARFAEGLKDGADQLVARQLGRLEIADSAFPLPQEQSWLLPFSREELGIADDSELKIKAALLFPTSEERFTYQVVLFGDFTSASSVPFEFHNKVKALHLGDDKLDQAASIQRLLEAANIRVERVLISHYVPMIETTRTTPTGLVLDQGGTE